MKKFSFLYIILILVISSCSNFKRKENKFSASDNVLKLQTIKHKGCGLFNPGAGSLYFQKPEENHFKLKFILPQGLDSIQIATHMLDIKPRIYRNFKEHGDTASFKYSVKKFHIDTALFPKQEIDKNYLSILKGTRHDSILLIVDQNNNRDFTDDTIRGIQPMEWKSEKSLIGFDYEIFNGARIVPAHSWINMGQSKWSKDLLCFVSQHVSATFSIDNKTYTIAVSDGQWNCSFDEINVAIIGEGGKMKDTLITEDFLKRGEYLKLGSQYYKFEDIANDGSSITLLKEDHFEKQTGTQIGMIAPDFKGHTNQGDSIALADYKGKYLLLANITSCWSPISSYQSYKELTEAYSPKIEILGIDNSPDFLQRNIKELNLKGRFIIAEDKNYSIQAHYRPDFCSRLCFLVNPEGRIVNKFEIADWKTALAKNF